MREQSLAGLVFALNQPRPGAELIGEWSLEQKSRFEICGSRGACWHHGVDTTRWPEMAVEAAKHGTSMYDIVECYADKGEVYFGSGRGKLNGEPLELRAHITHTLSACSDEYICVVWVKERGEVTVSKCASGFSGCYNPSEFHMPLVEKEETLPPPFELNFKE